METTHLTDGTTQTTYGVEYNVTYCGEALFSIHTANPDDLDMMRRRFDATTVEEAVTRNRICKRCLKSHAKKTRS